jgi:hypothetical protein
MCWTFNKQLFATCCVGAFRKQLLKCLVLKPSRNYLLLTWVELEHSTDSCLCWSIRYTAVHQVSWSIPQTAVYQVLRWNIPWKLFAKCYVWAFRKRLHTECSVGSIHRKLHNMFSVGAFRGRVFIKMLNIPSQAFTKCCLSAIQSNPQTDVCLPSVYWSITQMAKYCVCSIP